MRILNYQQINKLQQDLDVARQYRDHIRQQRDHHTTAITQLEEELREAECDLDEVLTKLLTAGWEG